MFSLFWKAITKIDHRERSHQAKKLNNNFLMLERVPTQHQECSFHNTIDEVFEFDEPDSKLVDEMHFKV